MRILDSKRTKICAVIACGVLASGIGLPATAGLIPKASAEYFKAGGVGYMTNVIKQDVGETDNGCPVLDPEFLKSDDINIGVEQLNEVKQQTITEVSYEALATEIKTENSKKVVGGLTYNAFTVNAYAKCGAGISQAKQQLTSQYYFIKSEETVLYSLTLENSAFFSDAYQEHFSDKYLSYLATLTENSTYEQYKEFFENCGTHVVVGAEYGAKVAGYYSVYSTETGFSSSVQNSFETGITAAFANNAKAGVSMDYDITEANSVVSGNLKVASKYYAKGGDVNAKASLQEGTGYTSWKNKVTQENATMVDYTYNGLRPVWKALPSQYEGLADSFERYFERYAKEAQDAQLDGLKETELLTATQYTTDMKLVRENQVTITDSDRWENYHDTIYIADTFGFHVDTLKTYGFSKVQINVQFEAKQIDAADARLMFIYQNENTSETNNIKLYEVSFGGIKTYTWKNFSTDKLNIDYLSHDEFVIRYRATGSFDDDWVNRNLSVQLVFYK